MRFLTCFLITSPTGLLISFGFHLEAASSRSLHMTLLGRPSLEVFSHLSYKVALQFLDLQMVVSDFSSYLDLFCHVIQSQAALTCASCARSLGSGNRCPGVFWSGVLVLLLPSFSSLSSMAMKLINFQSCIILLVAFPGNCQVWPQDLL